MRLPNIRKMFIPDPGHTIVDADLAGADAQVVAWEADDEDLKAAFRAGLKIHVHNCRTIYPHFHKDWADEEIKERPSPYYKKTKIGQHATNYGAVPPTLVARAQFTLSEAEEFQERWFHAHPNIKEWHERIERYLHGTQCWNCDNLEINVGKPCEKCGKLLGRTVKNAFGFRKIYQDRIDIKIRNEALAWGPQSTVIFCSDLGWVSMVDGAQFALQFSHAEREVHKWKRWLVEPDSYRKWHEIVQPLLQVHDSIVFQVPTEYEHFVPDIVDDLRVIVPYPDPLIIPLGFNSSRVSWGDC